MDEKEIIKNRVQKRIDTIPWEELDCYECYIGGNSLNRDNPNDFDIFPVGAEEIKTGKLKVLSETRNAKTVLGNGKVIQICNYRYENLELLVQSFDFAHIQIGAYLKKSTDKMEVQEIYFTKEYSKAKITEGSFYTGSKYPISSLIRLFKYQNRNDLIGKSYIIECLRILEDILIRGFHSYDDFKDQLDAVDLGLLPEDFEDASPLFFSLYHLLTDESDPAAKTNRKEGL